MSGERVGLAPLAPSYTLKALSQASLMQIPSPLILSQRERKPPRYPAHTNVAISASDFLSIAGTFASAAG
jgi:hypothetical protein